MLAYHKHILQTKMCDCKKVADPFIRVVYVNALINHSNDQ